jgi:hypothetical protein
VAGGWALQQTHEQKVDGQVFFDGQQARLGGFWPQG